MIIEGDAAAVLQTLPGQSVQLIVTSPPYADQRKSTYGGIHPNEYVALFMERDGEMWPVLRDD